MVRPDFSGYATRNDMLCSDGVVIRHGAFANDDGTTVPLVWQHNYTSPDNVLGHAKLEMRHDGMYAKCWLNKTPTAQNAKELILHGDVSALSIHAKNVKKQGNNVTHGKIHEVSLVLSGANPGAYIDFVTIEHSSDGSDNGEAVIYSDDTITHSGGEADMPPTIDEILGTLTPEQEEAVAALIDAQVDEELDDIVDAIEEDLEADDYDEDDYDEDDYDEDDYDEDEIEQSAFYGGGGLMHYNQFESGDTDSVLTHGELDAIMEDAAAMGSLKDAILTHSQTYGIQDISILFPDAKPTQNQPDFIKRRTEWVSKVVHGAKHNPFSRIKTVFADITADEARAKGYVKANRKTEEVFKLLKRSTGPTTIYKKQKFDRDDLVDITSFDVVSWVRAEMRLMLEEEIGRAILVGDGRQISHADKINEDCIRPIYKDDELYVNRVKLKKTDGNIATVDAILKARAKYRGTGNPTFFTTEETLTTLLLTRDKDDRRLWRTAADLAAEIRCSEIVTVDVLEGVFRTDEEESSAKYDLVGILVNMVDYTIGADAGGKVTSWDDFDIDYNQHKYLMETRMSGALTKYKSAVVVERAQV